ncbi:MAG: hypothetical protein HY395_00640 [Candidatus Doudnabacteria bacterium]|nr:hypothetical protein [Candidatus Doudnabacteria bacterium]
MARLVMFLLEYVVRSQEIFLLQVVEFALKTGGFLVAAFFIVLVTPAQHRALLIYLAAPMVLGISFASAQVAYMQGRQGAFTATREEAIYRLAEKLDGADMGKMPPTYEQSDERNRVRTQVGEVAVLSGSIIGLALMIAALALPFVVLPGYRAWNVTFAVSMSVMTFYCLYLVAVAQQATSGRWRLE